MSHRQSSYEPNNGANGADGIMFKAVCDGLVAHDQTGTVAGLTPLEHNILKAAWDQESYRIVAQRLYLTEGHVKDVASALWKRLTAALDLPLSKRTFRGLMEQHWGDRLRLQTEIPLPATSSSTVTSWADAPAVDRFYGRETEQHTLKKWLIRDRCRLVALLGLGGIGKTVLATTVGRAIADEFEVVIWRSLINAPPIQDFLHRLLVFLTQSIHAPSIPVPATSGNDFETQLLTLLEVLQTHRCLIILDNVETVLSSRSPSLNRSEFSEFSESDAYDQLFRRLGEAAHQSCLLITSREKPPVIARLDGPHAPVRTLFLEGLTPATARSLLEGLQSFDASPEDWQRLLDPYQGHPLVLELLAKHIDEAFWGDVAAFLEQDQRIFGDLERLLQWHFARLSPPEQLLLFWLAVYRHPVSLAQLRNDWRSPHALGSTLQSLQRRLPLVRKNQGVTLQPVLLEYVTAQLITDASQALLQGDLAALDRVCLLQASALDERRAIQRRVILRVVGDRCLTQCPKPQLINHCFALLEQFRRSPHSGYGAGNVLNLLIVLEADLRQRDFTRLTLREVDLQGCILQHSDFSGCHFDRMALTQPIQAILSAVASPDDRWFAAGSSDGSIQIYDADTTDQHHTLSDRHSQAWVYGLAFDATGTVLVSSGLDQILRVWHRDTGQCLQRHHLDSPAVKIAFDGVHCRWVMGHVTGQVRVWAAQEGGLPDMTQPVLAWTAHRGAMYGMAMDRDGRVLVTGSDEGQVCLWDLGTGQLRLALPQQLGRMRAIALNPAGNCIATVSENHTITLWNGETGQQRLTLRGHGAAVKALQFHGTEPWLISAAYDDTVRVWDVDTGQCVKVLMSPGSQRLDVMAVAGDRLMVGSKDQTLQFWDLSTGQCGRSLQGFVCGTKALVFADQGKTLLSSGLDHYIWQWNLADLDSSRSKPQAAPQFWKQHHSNVWALAISPDAPQRRRLLASGDYNGVVTLWDVADQYPLRTWTAHSDMIRAIAFSPHQPWVATASADALIKIWDTGTGECRHTLRGHRGMVQALAFLPQGDHLVSGGNDGTIRIWHGLTGILLNTWRVSEAADAIQTLALHPTHPHVVTGDSRGIIKLWNWETGDCLAITPGHRNLIWSVAISSDGQWIASGSQDQTLRLWQLSPKTHQPSTSLINVATFSHEMAVGAVAFDPTGGKIVGGCLNETLHIYNVATQRRDRILTIPRPYEGMNLQRTTGLSAAQWEMLQRLGATPSGGRALLQTSPSKQSLKRGPNGRI